MKILRWFVAVCATSACMFGHAEGEVLERERPPNFLVIVADDMGWSDLGVLGGEIRTPTLDALAHSGTLLTDFYVAPTCAPTRAMLLTGVDNHRAGLGVQSGMEAPNQVGRNYRGQLHGDVVTMAEALAPQGYRSYMSGKWHLADNHDFEAQAPHNRGFDRSFTLITGGASHFADQKSISPSEIANYVEDGRRVETLPSDFYSTISYTDKMLAYLEAHEDESPFFAYLAYTAPHDPLGVPDNWLDRYAGHYDEGPYAVRVARADRQRSKGLLPTDAELWVYPSFPSWFPNHAAPWSERDDLSKARSARRMEIYASMVELMDAQIGRVLDHLERSGQLQNTYVIFFSDNGASAPGPLVYPGVTKEWLAEHWDNSLERRGRPGNFTVQGREWASVSVTPFKLYKASVSEGGIRSPLIISGPGVMEDQFDPALAHVTDIAPTIYELAGVDESHEVFLGKERLRGYSLLPILRDDGVSTRESFGVHLFGNRGFRRGNWKITNTQPPLSSGEWELFNLETDPGETTDLSAQFPAIKAELLAGFDVYLAQNDVIIPSESPLRGSLRSLYPEPCDWWCETRFTIINWLL